MRYMPVFLEYLSWNYGSGIKEYLKAWGNMHWFLYHFFSISLLWRTFFKPFHRITESYGRGFDPAKISETIIVNTIMRIVGMMIRTVLLTAGILAQGVALLGGIIFLLLFLSSPALIPIGILFSVLLITDLV